VRNCAFFIVIPCIVVCGRKEEQMKKQKTERQEVTEILSSLENFFQKGSCGAPPWYIHTGNLALDYIISGRVDGTGGWPGERIVEIFGDPMTGKSLLITLAGASIQKEGGLFVLADAEGRWDADFAMLHGVNPENVLIFEPLTIEEFTIKTYEFLDKIKGKVNKVLVALDSLAALSTESEIDSVEKKEIREDQGKRAKRIHAAMRILPRAIKEANGVLLISNHVISDPSHPYSGGRTTPGGKAVPFQSSVRLELLSSQKLTIEGKNRPIGNRLHAVCTKNSIQPPYGQCYFDLYWGKGVSKFSGLVELAVDLGILSKSGPWIKFGEKTFREKDIEKFVQETPEFLQHPKWANPYFKSLEADDDSAI